MYSIAEFKRKLFVLSVKELSPYHKKIKVSNDIFLQEGLPFILEIQTVDSIALPQLQIGFSELRKLLRNLCSSKSQRAAW